MQDNRLDFNIILEKYSYNPALIWSDGRLTYLQYFKRIVNLSERLIQKGVKPGTRIAILSDIDYRFPILFFATLIAGGIVVPMNPKFPDKQINELLAEINCEYLINLNSSFSIEPASNVKQLDEILNYDITEGYQIPAKINLLSFDQEATIVFTSGSGGKAKGVLHTIGNHYYSAVGSAQRIPLSSTDCWMVSLPFFHIAGIAILFRSLLAGAACYISDNNHNINAELKQKRITHLSLVSTQLYRLLEEADITSTGISLKAVLLGGSQISQILIERALHTNLPIHTSYGSTEMSSQITTTTIEELKLNPRSSGKLLLYRKLMIDDTGEILVRGRTLTKGYISANNISPCTDGEGWFHSGDLGYFDENQNLIVTGRRDHMFMSGGENIHPEEIEQYLQFHDKIKDVCVVDVPDDEYGARPVVFVKMASDEEINDTSLKNYLRDKIATFKTPVRFFSWPEGAEGLKPDRKYLREVAIKNMSY